MSKLKTRRDARAAAGNTLYTDRKALILKAAGDVFLRKGFLATKLSDIAEEANMDRASLYYYVSSKQDLFEELFYESISQNVINAKVVDASDLSSVEKLAKLIQMLMDSFEKKYPLFYIFVQEDLKKIEQINDPKNDHWLATSKKLSREYFDILDGIIADGIAKKEIKASLPSNLLTRLLIGMANSSATWFSPDGKMSGQEIGKAISEMVLNGVSNS